MSSIFNEDIDMSFANADMLRDTAHAPNASYANSAFKLPTYTQLKPDMHSMHNTMQTRLLNNTQSLDSMIQNNKHISTSLYDTASMPTMNNPMADMYAGASNHPMQAYPLSQQYAQYGQNGHAMSNMFGTAMPATAVPFSTHSMFDTQMPNMQSNVELVPVESEPKMQDTVTESEKQKKVCTSSHEMAQRLFSTPEHHLNNAQNMDKILKNHKTSIEQVDSKVNSVTKSMCSNEKQNKKTFATHKNAMEELWNKCTKLKTELDALKSHKKKSQDAIAALNAGVKHHKDTFDKMHTRMHQHQLENIETADEHAEKISSLEHRVSELSTAVQVHANILEEHHDQLNETSQNKYQVVSNDTMKFMAPRRR